MYGEFEDLQRKYRVLQEELYNCCKAIFETPCIIVTWNDSGAI
jgi:hypothetical protein